MKPSHIYNNASHRTYCGIESNGTASGITRSEDRYPFLKDGEKFCKRCVANMEASKKRYHKVETKVYDANNPADLDRAATDLEKVLSRKQPLDYNGNHPSITFPSKPKIPILKLIRVVKTLTLPHAPENNYDLIFERENGEQIGIAVTMLVECANVLRNGINQEHPRL